MAGAREAERRFVEWMRSTGAPPLPFQRETWRAWRAGASGLIHAPTGSGKTLAVWGAALIEAMTARPSRTRMKAKLQGPRVLWITPLRALAGDTLVALRRPLDALGIEWKVIARTGDSSASDRRRTREGAVDALITTPESLSLLLSHEDARQRFARLSAVIVDEWHELLGSKRGVQLELCLARLRTFVPSLRTWGLSATLGNPAQALDVLLGDAEPGGHVVAADVERRIAVDGLVPATIERFPWTGHLGLSQLPRVLDAVQSAQRSLVFTNTRSQAELWHRALASVWPDAPERLALHHGSLEPAIRREVEDGLRDGRLRCVVATSSLDLGVDFPAVEQVIQIGSPKGIARLMQRAGRSGHSPGQASRVLCVPTHALELAEIAAARIAIEQRAVEPRTPLIAPLDVLAQHLTTLALGEGFAPAEVFDEVRRSHAYRDLDAARFDAVLAFLRQGGASLHAYPGYRRLAVDAAGVYRPVDARIARLHRYAIGTITSDGALSVRLRRGARLGSIEEGFLARLKPGEAFLFAGRLLELVRIHEMTAYVKPATARTGSVATWQGSRMPLSTQLAERMAALLARPDDSAEMRALAGLLDLQRERSLVPQPDELLVELHRTRDGQHLVLFPFAGRLVHEGLAALVAFRLGRMSGGRGGFRFAVNDYGLIVGATRLPALDEEAVHALLSPAGVADVLAEAMSLAELARRRFRDVARIAGLILPMRPGAERSLRQLQTSSGLLFDVLAQHEPDHVLIEQARREVLEQELELQRLIDTLCACADKRLRLLRPVRLTPLAFPLWAERMRGQLSFDDWQARARQFAAQLEQAA
jgi:ATP-dependent Lhr-like helicase